MGTDFVASDASGHVRAFGKHGNRIGNDITINLSLALAESFTGILEDLSKVVFGLGTERTRQRRTVTSDLQAPPTRDRRSS